MNTTVKNMLLATAGAAVLMAGSSAMGSADSKITIKSGDTLSQLAIEYDATVEDLVSSNNIKDANKIWAGDKLVITGKAAKDLTLTDEQKEVVAEVKEEVEVKQAEQAPAEVAAAPVTVEAPVETEVNTNVSVAAENKTIETPAATKEVSAPVTGRSGNAYMAGQCTAYVYDRASFVGSFWGNANQWVSSAAAAGRTISGTATAGSVAVFAAGQQGAGPLGHVAYVESVNGGMMTISEGNYAGKAYNTRTISTAGVTFIR
ncbi:CHAP domain-containing protein [Weissella ceti]|uniref:CHAP domain-containing protein n=1 Tax=Weissella ceti TaxID=759620 RepID=A0ABT3E5W7_9LACO|nr:CHAP domain-containing protein [Weissella ceti]MCW0953770.1 CHAP domain-containing protein [Weissella ceti]QVK11857.1 CHAP domain-containing protein [Weissella ceti]